MSDSAAAEPQTDAAKRAAARRAKILARGNTGLQKLAQTARGDEAEKLYGGDSASSSRPLTPSSPPPRSESAPSWIPPTASNQPSQANMGGSTEQQAMADQLQKMMAMMGGGGMGAGGAEGGMPDMSNLLAQMMGGGGAGGPNLLGGIDDPSASGLGSNPFDPSGAGGMAGFPDLSQFANMGMGGMGGMGMPQKGKTWVERSFPLIHAVGMLMLLAFVIGWWEPSIRLARWAGSVDGTGTIGRWARLAGRKGGWRGATSGLLGDVESLPLFWGFTTVELILQTTRFLILKSPPPPHSLLSTFLPMLPPKISRPLLTGSRYLTMLSQIYKDGCLLIFGVGVFVILSEYITVA